MRLLGSVADFSSSTIFNPSALADQPRPAPAKQGRGRKIPPVSFVNEVMAVLGKAGCNAGVCHGNASGKGGFKLSLRGYNPAADLEAITRDELGRRVNPVAAEASLVLQKPAGLVEHGGGQRFGVDSESYRLLHQWLQEGARGDFNRAPRLEKIEVFPESRILSRPGLTQQLVVRAHFAGGLVRDVTDQAIYELTSQGIVDVDGRGLVTAREVGEAPVLVRFLGKKALSRITVIQARPDFAWSNPSAHNFIDTHVFAKLKAVQVLPSELSSDTEFLRRVSFDTVGLPPTPAEVRAFLADTASRQAQPARSPNCWIGRNSRTCGRCTGSISCGRMKRRGSCTPRESGR